MLLLQRVAQIEEEDNTLRKTVKRCESKGVIQA